MWRKTSYGELTGKRSALWNARLRTVHAGKLTREKAGAPSTIVHREHAVAA
jgi:hypothetical protein